MNNFKSSGPGGMRKRPEFMGGRPKSDANYGPKKSFEKKSFGGNDRGGSRGNDRGGDRGGFGGGNRGGERREVELFKTVCTTCGKPCEVPFKPDGSKPVLCRDCFANKSDDRGGSQTRDRFSNDRPARAPERKFDAPSPERGPSPDFKALTQQIKTLESKMHEVLELLRETPVKAPAKAPAKATEVDAAPAKVRKPKKEVVAKKVAKKAAKKAVKKVAKKK